MTKKTRSTKQAVRDILTKGSAVGTEAALHSSPKAVLLALKKRGIKTTIGTVRNYLAMIGKERNKGAVGYHIRESNDHPPTFVIKKVGSDQEWETQANDGPDKDPEPDLSNLDAALALLAGAVDSNEKMIEDLDRKTMPVRRTDNEVPQLEPSEKESEVPVIAKIDNETSRLQSLNTQLRHILDTLQT